MRAGLYILTFILTAATHSTAAAATCRVWVHESLKAEKSALEKKGYEVFVTAKGLGVGEMNRLYDLGLWPDASRGLRLYMTLNSKILADLGVWKNETDTTKIPPCYQLAAFGDHSYFNGYFGRLARARLDAYYSSGKSAPGIGELFLQAETLRIHGLRNFWGPYKRIAEKYRGLVSLVRYAWDGSKAEPDMLKRLDQIRQVLHPYYENYYIDQPLLSFALEGPMIGNCQASTQLFLFTMIDAGIDLGPDFQLGAQHFNDHIQAVVWNSKTERLYELAGGGRMPLKGPVYSPELLTYALARATGRATSGEREPMLKWIAMDMKSIKWGAYASYWFLDRRSQPSYEWRSPFYLVYDPSFSNYADGQGRPPQTGKIGYKDMSDEMNEAFEFLETPEDADQPEELKQDEKIEQVDREFAEKFGLSRAERRVMPGFEDKNAEKDGAKSTAASKGENTGWQAMLNFEGRASELEIDLTHPDFTFDRRLMQLDPASLHYLNEVYWQAYPENTRPKLGLQRAETLTNISRDDSAKKILLKPKAVIRAPRGNEAKSFAEGMDVAFFDALKNPTDENVDVPADPADALPKILGKTSNTVTFTDVGDYGLRILGPRSDVLVRSPLLLKELTNLKRDHEVMARLRKLFAEEAGKRFGRIDLGVLIGSMDYVARPLQLQNGALRKTSNAIQNFLVPVRLLEQIGTGSTNEPGPNYCQFDARTRQEAILNRAQLKDFLLRVDALDPDTHFSYFKLQLDIQEILGTAGRLFYCKSTGHGHPSGPTAQVLDAVILQTFSDHSFKILKPRIVIEPHFIIGEGADKLNPEDKIADQARPGERAKPVDQKNAVENADAEVDEALSVRTETLLSLLMAGEVQKMASPLAQLASASWWTPEGAEYYRNNWSSLESARRNLATLWNWSITFEIPDWQWPSLRAVYERQMNGPGTYLSFGGGVARVPGFMRPLVADAIKRATPLKNAPAWPAPHWSSIHRAPLVSIGEVRDPNFDGDALIQGFCSGDYTSVADPELTAKLPAAQMLAVDRVSVYNQTHFDCQDPNLKTKMIKFMALRYDLKEARMVNRNYYLRPQDDGGYSGKLYIEEFTRSQLEGMIRAEQADVDASPSAN